MNGRGGKPARGRLYLPVAEIGCRCAPSRGESSGIGLIASGAPMERKMAACVIMGA
jgi:hypothetical protein